ncbi:Nodule Cysteine-Rich (NCR) secreted peptide [Medicago truncatula]|uniref:Nodule Cysteine-Rich (NCR) secreted peptide n=2 Tax=Medicago truncatula TaxID=3880 RepID=G7IT95_MEDTR|nr:Nodule Cysteine-Rich (NCR) secreted peptide [Medicago truncatula]
MGGIIKIVYAFVIFISLILIVTSNVHSLLPCGTDDDCANDPCIHPEYPHCHMEQCHCV